MKRLRPLLALAPGLLALFALAALPALAATAEPAPRIFMIGDSTMANKPLDLPERGWGMAFAELVAAPATVHNRAVNGRSTKSFIAEGRWEKVVGQLQPGDFVIVQFGHNDEKIDDSKRGTDPATTFRENLRRFLRDTRAAGATPILATPVCRRKFDADGRLVDTHGAYADATRAVAAEDNVALLDLQHATAAWLQSLGDAPSRKFFMWFAPGEHPRYPDGLRDDTHFVAAGAEKVAALAAAEIRAQALPLARWLR